MIYANSGDASVEIFNLFQNIVAPILLGLISIFAAVGEAWFFIKSFGAETKKDRYHLYTQMIIAAVIWIGLMVFISVGVYGVWQHFVPDI